MNNLPSLDDLNIFLQVAKRASFAAVADELGMSAAYISKRIRMLEQNLEVRLLHRTTRRVTVSEEG
ncbi:LysR family transcriptional regulator, partial [Pseudomonas sp. SIMBA_065]